MRLFSDSYIFYILHILAWIRIVWKEGEHEEEGMTPSCWINEHESSVCWPSQMTVLRAAHERRAPDEFWNKFTLIKVKVKDG